MRTFILYLLIFNIILCIYLSIFRKYIFAPYKFKLYVGKPGSGKTTLMTKHAANWMKRKKTPVYSNVDLDLPNIRIFDPRKIGIGYFFEAESLVLIDEPNLYWDNRQYKNTKKDVIEWFRLYRHNRVNIRIYSQTFDVDVKLRRLISDIYLIKKYAGTITTVRQVIKNITIKDSAMDAESQIVDELKFAPFFAGYREFLFIPHWTKYFDSFYMPTGQPIPYQLKIPNRDSTADPGTSVDFNDPIEPNLPDFNTTNLTK